MVSDIAGSLEKNHIAAPGWATFRLTSTLQVRYAARHHTLTTCSRSKRFLPVLLISATHGGYLDTMSVSWLQRAGTLQL
jgi:hypothetical protein